MEWYYIIITIIIIPMMHFIYIPVTSKVFGSIYGHAVYSQM